MSADANVEIVRRAIDNSAEPGVFAEDVVWHFTAGSPAWLPSTTGGRRSSRSSYAGSWS